jgi:hypothetical protein
VSPVEHARAADIYRIYSQLPGQAAFALAALDAG